MQRLEPTKKISGFRLFMWLFFWLNLVVWFVFSTFSFYDKSINSLLDNASLVIMFMLGIHIFSPIWRDGNLWRILGIGICAFAAFILLGNHFLSNNEYDYYYYSLLESKPLKDGSCKAKLERRYDTAYHDCPTKLVLCYERNYWNVLKDTKDIYSVVPGSTGSFDINANGNLLTLRANAEDSNHTKIVKTFSTDWYQVKPEMHY